MIKGTPVYGFGINDANYPVNITECLGLKRKIVWRCPYYQKWVNMLERVYGSTRLAYEKVEVCHEWSSFMAFKSWMQKQDWECKELDKDLIGNGKLYSPETCIFISKKVNMFLQFSTPKFYKGYWQIATKLPDKTKHRFRRKCRESVFKNYVEYKKLTLSMLNDEDCPPNVRALVECKLNAFYEENL